MCCTATSKVNDMSEKVEVKYGWRDFDRNANIAAIGGAASHKKMNQY